MLSIKKKDYLKKIIIIIMDVIVVCRIFHHVLKFLFDPTLSLPVLVV